MFSLDRSDATAAGGGSLSWIIHEASRAELYNYFLEFALEKQQQQ